MDSNANYREFEDHAVLAAEQVELAYDLTMLAGLTISKEYNGALKGLATKLAGFAASTA